MDGFPCLGRCVHPSGQGWGLRRAYLGRHGSGWHQRHAGNNEVSILYHCFQLFSGSKEINNSMLPLISSTVISIWTDKGEEDSDPPTTLPVAPVKPQKSCITRYGFASVSKPFSVSITPPTRGLNTAFSRGHHSHQLCNGLWAKSCCFWI